MTPAPVVNPSPMTYGDLVASRATRLGLQVLFTQNGRWFVSITNRTYQSTVEILPEKVEAWKRALTRR